MSTRTIACRHQQAIVDCDAPMMCLSNCHNYRVVVIERAIDGQHFERMDTNLRQLRCQAHQRIENNLRVSAIKFAARW